MTSRVMGITSNLGCPGDTWSTQAESVPSDGRRFTFGDRVRVRASARAASRYAGVGRVFGWELGENCREAGCKAGWAYTVDFGDGVMRAFHENDLERAK